MRFEELDLPGAYRIELDRHEDERGFFARIFCVQEFAKTGLETKFEQMSISYNARRGTVRGMHFQVPPWEEVKVVRCISGAIHDVIIDLRRQSSTYLHAIGIDLSAENRTALYIPKGFAHGFQALSDGAEVLYAIDTAYVEGAAGGIRPDDPAIGIIWPEPIAVISDRDRNFPDWRE